MKSGVSKKPKVYLTSPVFLEISKHPKVSINLKNKIKVLWSRLDSIADVIVSKERFPSPQSIKRIVKNNSINFIGCHLSHKISKETMEIDSVKAVSTSTAGYNHIFSQHGVLITHTPSILDKTVADFTISLILANLRNIMGLHNYLWEGNWSKDKKWDLDENLTNTIDNLTLGIIGLGEIGYEIVRRIAPWGIKILYFDITRYKNFEKKYKNLHYKSKLKEIFALSDIISLHVPLNDKTQGFIGKDLLMKMKDNALLVNTARGKVIDFPILIDLLKSKEISINLAFDVYDPEPLSQNILSKFKDISKERPELKFIFTPHNASSDANTRAEMSIILLTDIINLCMSRNYKDLKKLRLIPSQRKFKKDSKKNLENLENLEDLKKFRIYRWWKIW